MSLPRGGFCHFTAAGLTGGYGSTYAQNAGQQAYDNYLLHLTSCIPELVQAARSAYDSEGDRQIQQYNLSLAKAAGSGSGSSSGKSSSKAEKIYDGMTDSDLTAKIRSMLAKLPTAQVAKVLQGDASVFGVE